MLRAYVDESGDRGFSPWASDFFIMSAAVIDDSLRPRMRAEIAAIRQQLGKPRRTVLRFSKNVRDHGARVAVSKRLARINGLDIVNVVLCKRALDRAPMLSTDPDAVYLWTLRLMLERLTWMARDAGTPVIVTFAHVRRFPYGRLRHYLNLLKQQGTEIKWGWLRSVRINQPRTLEMLQVADLVAAAAGRAFEPDRWGVTEPRYLFELAPRLHRRPPGPLTSYGMKLHPAKAVQQHAWVKSL